MIYVLIRLVPVLVRDYTVSSEWILDLFHGLFTDFAVTGVNLMLIVRSPLLIIILAVIDLALNLPWLVIIHEDISITLHI